MSFLNLKRMRLPRARTTLLSQLTPSPLLTTFAKHPVPGSPFILPSHLPIRRFTTQTSHRLLRAMAPKQSTLGNFFTKANGSNSGPKQQTTLSFSTKSKDKEDGTVDGNDKQTEEKEKEKDQVKKKRKKEDVKAEDKEESEKEVKNESSGSDIETKKRGRGRPPKSKAKEKTPKSEPVSDADDEPVAKRPRKTQRRKAIEDDEDDEAMLDAKSEPQVETEEDIKPTRSSSSSPAAAKRTKKIASPKKTKVASPKKKAAKKEAEEDSSTSSVEDSIEEEGKKPIASTKARKAMQAALTSKDTKDLYPDWEPNKPVPYAALCTTFSLIEMTSKRLIIMECCSRFLKQVLRLTPDDLLPTVLLMINKLAPDYSGIELGIGESLIMKAIGESTGRSLQVIKTDQKTIGDLGLVAVKSRSNQPTMFKPKPLTVRGVHQGLMEIATVSGNGSQGKKIDLIKRLLSASDTHLKGKVDITKDKGGPSEAKFLVRFLEGKLRLGLGERTVVPSLSQAMVMHEVAPTGKLPSTANLEKAETLLKTIYSELPSYDVIIPAMLKYGIMNLREHCNLRPGVPLKPMLAKPTKAITEVLDRFENQTFTCEYKYDGERAQIHYVAKDSSEEINQTSATTTTGKGVAAIFSRNSEDLSQKYPDVLVKLGGWVKDGTKSFVLDCETVAWDTIEKKVLPFQQLMTRKKKDVKIEDVKVQVCVFAFDILYLNGEAVVTKSLRERRDLLRESFVPVEGEFSFATSMNGQELDDIQIFLDESVKASCEGLMVKMLDGKESGYEPSMRSRNWLKVKKDYLAGVGDSLDLVVLGAYHGKGKRASMYGAFLLACYNPKSDSYETICNIGTGFSEAVLEEFHTQLSEIVIDKPKPFYSHSIVPQHQPDVWFEPKYVWEVKTADLTLSPRYKAGCKEGADPSGDGRGISLRFPRFIKLRDDKKCEQATSSRQVAEMYGNQESVTKTKGPSVDDDFEY